MPSRPATSHIYFRIAVTEREAAGHAPTQP